MAPLLGALLLEVLSIEQRARDVAGFPAWRILVLPPGRRLAFPPRQGSGVHGRLRPRAVPIGSLSVRLAVVRPALAGALAASALLGVIGVGSSGRAPLLRARGQRQCEDDGNETDVSHGITYDSFESSGWHRSTTIPLCTNVAPASNVSDLGMASAAGPLFGPDLPPGFLYQDDFISAAEQAELVEQINQIEFSTFEMRGVVAKRRVAFFGASYDRGAQPSPPIPEFLSPVRIRLADLAGVTAVDFAMVLINEYRPGTPIGWHRDAPQYELIAGVSLLSSCRMRLRPYVAPSQATESGLRRTTTHELELRPRSAYVMKGEARSGYEHSIPAVTALRYSITFRTLR